MKKLLLQICEFLLGDYAIIPKSDIKIIRSRRTVTLMQINQAGIGAEAAKQSVGEIAMSDVLREMPEHVMLQKTIDSEAGVYSVIAQVILIAPKSKKS